MTARIILATLAASASAFSPVASFSPVAAPQRVSSPQMSADGFSRRAAFAAIFAVPAAANAMAVPGLNSPGLVPAKKVRSGLTRADFDEKIRDADTNHFWSPKGIMDSVPKMKGIITPKTAGFKTK